MSDMPGQEPDPGSFGPGSADQGAGPDPAGADQNHVPTPPAQAPPGSPGPAFRPPGVAPEPPTWSPAGGQWSRQPSGPGQWPGQPSGQGQWPGAQAPGAGGWQGQPPGSGQWPAGDATAQVPFGYYPQPPPRRRRTGLIVGLVVGGVVVLVAAAVGIGLAVGHGASSSKTTASGPHRSSAPAAPSSSPAVVPGAHSLTLPHAVDGYTRETGSTAGGLVSAMRRQMRSEISSSGSPWARALSNAKIGLYINPATPSQPLVFVGYSAASNPQIAPVLANPSLVIDGFFVGAGIASSKAVPAGPLGGTMRCGSHSGATGRSALCAWADSSTLGMIVAPGKTAAQLAPVLLEFRNHAEH